MYSPLHGIPESSNRSKATDRGGETEGGTPRAVDVKYREQTRTEGRVGRDQDVLTVRGRHRGANGRPCHFSRSEDGHAQRSESGNSTEVGSV